VRRAGAAVGEQNEIPRIHAPFYRELADQVGHPAIDDVDHAFGRFKHVTAERLRDLFSYSGFGLGSVELFSPVKKPIGIDTPQDHIGVCHRGLDAALIVGHGTRDRSRALRTHL
jgi:hypothetical protein